MAVLAVVSALTGILGSIALAIRFERRLRE
jgi:hypothetical protein